MTPPLVYVLTVLAVAICRLGSPPQILWLTCGNVTNRNLKQLLTATLPDALEQLRQGEMIVEISNTP